MKIAITTLGCKVNQFESAALSDMFRSMGHKLVRFNEAADIYIVNTCTVTGKTDFQSRQMVRRANRMNPDAAIIVTGCYAQSSPDHFFKLDGVRLVTGNAEKERLPELISRLDTSSGKEVLVGDIKQAGVISRLAPSSFPGRTRAFIRIQDGCNSSCAYCVVPSVRGKSRSMPFEEVGAQVDRLAAAGHLEIVLSGIHLGMYGKDLTPAVKFTDLLHFLESHSPIRRIRLSSIEPQEISPDVMKFLEGSKVVCPHLHIPLQSGDDEILAAMNRDYNSGFYAELAGRLFRSIPGLAMGTDIIVGFPGETERNFDNTVALVNSIPFSYLHVFPYSDRPGTAASAMQGKVSSEVKNRRAAVLREIGVKKRQSFAEKFTGKSLSVLIEGRRDRETGCLKGFSENYVPVLVRNAAQDDVNSIVTVMAEKFSSGKIVSRMERAAEAGK
jgi:threonylcarbamoyladenosine tRNA methylthiotransferase MtaB